MDLGFRGLGPKPPPSLGLLRQNSGRLRQVNVELGHLRGSYLKGEVVSGLGFRDQGFGLREKGLGFRD